MRLSRQGIGFLFRAFLVGILICSSNSWAMDLPASQKKVPQPTHKLNLEYYPKDLWFYIYGNFLPPKYWAKAREVSRFWNHVFNDKLLWQHVRGYGLVSPHPNDSEAVEILNTLFTSPKLAMLFNIPRNPTPSLETLQWMCYKKEATVDTFRTLYTTVYSNNLGKIKEALLIKRSIREGSIRKREIELKNNITQALEHGHPEAAWKLAKICSPDKKNYTCLDAGLAGHPKARAEIVRILFKSLQASLLNPSESREQLKYYFTQLNKLAQIWPEGRAYLLQEESNSRSLHAPRKNDPNAQFHIGDGIKTTLALGLPLPITWPEAHLIDAEFFYDLYKKNFVDLNYVQAQNLFVEACKQNAVGSRLAYVKFLKPIPENLEFFQRLSADLENLESFQRSSETSETLGTVFFKLCQSKLAAISENAGDNDPTIHDFLTVFKRGYEALSRNNGFLPTYGHNQRIDEYDSHSIDEYDPHNGAYQLPHYPIKREHHLLTAVAQSLPLGAKNQSVRYAFIDWNIKEFPSYCTTGWIKDEISGYLEKKWGLNFCNEGKLPKKGKLPKAASWNKRDTAYANIYFFSHASRTVRRNFYDTLMINALQRKEEETFSGAFESYCHSLKEDKLGVKHCELLSKNLDAFLTLFPGNAAVPCLFGQFVLEKKQWTINKSIPYWKEKAMEYCEIAANNGSQEAVEYYKILATKGSQKAIDFFQKYANNGSEDAQNFLVSLASMQDNESSSQELDSEDACNSLVSLSSKRKNEYSSEEPPTKKRMLSGKTQEENY